MASSPESSLGIVLGVDIKSGSPRGRKAIYSVVILRGKERKYVEIDKFGLLEVIRREKPSILAVDNIYEIVEDSGSLIPFLESLPEETKVVQVTGSLDGGGGLEKIARREGLWKGGKMDSKKSAEVIAELAARGYGVEVASPRSECRVLITKNRSVKQGGSGTERWRRSIESGILSEANELAASLDREGIDYDLYVEKGAGGLKRAEFVVYAPRSVVRRLVREREWGPIKVAVRDSWRRTLETRPRVLRWGRRPVVVGIDPGMSVGLAVMDLEGRVLSLRTIRRASRSEIVEAILEHGSPVVITTDSFPTPKSVQKVAQMVGAKLLTMRETMKVDEKNRLVREFSEREGIKVGSSHERDALAPLIRLMARYKNLFRKADSYVKENSLKVNKVKMYEALMRGRHISEAAKLATEREEGVPSVRRPRQTGKRKRSERIRSLIGRIRVLEEEISYLRGMIREKEAEIGELKRTLEELKKEMRIEVRRERLVSALESRIKSLEDRLRREVWRNELLRSEVRSISSQRGEMGDGWIQVKFVESLARDVLEEVISKGEVEGGDILLTFDASVAGSRSAKMLASLGLSGLIVRGPYPSQGVRKILEEAGIPIIDGFDVRISWRGITPLIEEEVAAEISRRRRKTRTERGEEHRGGKPILRILEEYRSKISEGIA